MRPSLLVLAGAIAAPACGPPPESQAPVRDTGSLASPTEGKWRAIVDLDQPVPTGPLPDAVLAKLDVPVRRSQEECGPDDATFMIATSGGSFAGAFSARWAKEKAFIVNMRPCKAGSATEKHRFIVLAGDSVVLSADVQDSTMHAVPDIDADGDNEILLTAETKDGATVIRTARLYEIDENKLQALYDFGPVARSQCPGGERQSATIQFRTVGTRMEFHADKRVRPCP